MSTNARPIGVFDSGIGGLTVLRAIHHAMPGEPIIFVADQAHVPYGGRPLSEVRSFALAISRFLVECDCRAVVMGCNISSAVALETAQQELAPLPVIGMIDPAAQALARHGDRRIGVLATEGTVRSDAYGGALLRYIPGAEITQVPCPRFVPIVESGNAGTPDAADAAREYLTPLAAAGVTAVILGCTHYPFLLPVLQRVATSLFAKAVTFMDPSDQTAHEVAMATPPTAGPSESPCLLLTTGDIDAFRTQAARCLPDVAFTISAAQWSQDDAMRLTSDFKPLPHPAAISL